MNADQPINSLGCAKMQSEENNQSQMGTQPAAHQALWPMPSLPPFLFPPWNYPPSLPVNYPQFNPLMPPPPPPLPLPSTQSAQHLLHSNLSPYNSHQRYYSNILPYDSEFSPLKIEGSGELKMREDDQAFVDNYFRKLDTNSELKSSIKICEALDLAGQCMQSISKLKTARHEMQLSLKDDDCFQKKIEETKMIKNRLEGILSIFNSSNLRRLKYSISKRKAKRKRLRTLAAATTMKERATHCKELHEKIDDWQQSFKQELLNAEMEKKLKEEADLILNEVRKKKSDANKLLNLLQAVEKLRNLKRDSAFKKSKLSFDGNDDFHKSVLDLQQVLTLRLANYEEEEKTLQVMLTEEHQETRKSVQQQIAEDENIKLQFKRKEELFCLFGPNETINEDDPLHPYWLAYTQADIDLDALVDIRRKWDNFIVPCDTPHSSGIPLKWVLPSEPSSKGWKKYLIE